MDTNVHHKGLVGILQRFMGRILGVGYVFLVHPSVLDVHRTEQEPVAFLHEMLDQTSQLKILVKQLAVMVSFVAVGIPRRVPGVRHT